MNPTNKIVEALKRYIVGSMALQRFNGLTI